MLARVNHGDLNSPAMKVRDSGMPEQAYWESLLDVIGILDALRVERTLGDVAEIGCGYGTFTVPVAQRIGGTLHSFDIDPAMVDFTRQRLNRAQQSNARVHQRDVLAEGFGLPRGSMGAVLLFNILHAENPVQMLRASAELLSPQGRLLAIHWRSDVATPRGPDLSIRPRPNQLENWAAETGLLQLEQEAEIVPPWHFVMAFQRR
jgi:SAM-dependent methyltransferase